MLGYLEGLYMAATLLSLVYLILSVVVTRRRMKAVSAGGTKFSGAAPLVSIFKPLKGHDDQLEENLRSFFQLDYPHYELLFGLQEKADPAFNVVRGLQKELPDAKVKIIVNDHEVGLNPKINNLYNMFPYASGRFLLISDSNTRVGRDFLCRMMRVALEPGVGIVTATIRGRGAKKTGAVLENLHMNSYISPAVFLADALSGIPVVIGKSILMPVKLLRDIGGFKAFKNYLAEDYLLGLRVREKGFKIKTVNTFVDNINIHWSLGRFFNRHTRWAKMRRHMHLYHYLIESFSNPVALSFILALLLQNGWGWQQFMAVGFFKIFHDAYLSSLMKSDLQWYHYLLVPVKDLMISILWPVPFFSKRVRWRGNSFSIGPQTRLKSV